MFHDDWNKNLEKIRHLNAIVFAGGKKHAEYINFTHGIYNYVKELNDEGEYYPLWGTCLGFESLIYFELSWDSKFMSDRSANHTNLAIEFLVPTEETRMWSGLGADAYKFAEQNLTFHGHLFGLDPQMFLHDENVKNLYTPTTLGYDKYGEPFVNTYESKRYPFYGSQFHPEKAAYVFSPGFNLDHHDDYINLNRHFAEFFV